MEKTLPFGKMLVIEAKEKLFVNFEASFCKIQHKCERNEFKHIDFISFAIIIYISEEILLVGQLVVVFEMIERLFEDAVIYAVLVFVVFVALLPS